ncbi:MAG: NosD domain-containing protein [Candidatus Bathyarchaeia archaeon]
MKKIVSALMLALLVISVLTAVLKVQPVKSSYTYGGTIYILADGRVVPTDAPISTVDYVTYTFTDDIVIEVPEGARMSAIVINRNDIVLDGAGHMLQGVGIVYESTGIDLTERRDVIIKNIKISGFTFGIHLNYSSGIDIHGDDITNNGCGLWLSYSSYNSISGNNITANSWEGIMIYVSDNNIVCRNNITNNGYGLWLSYSSYNSISGNNITANSWEGIGLDYSSNNSISGNMFTDDGLFVWDSYDNVIKDNLVNGKPLIYLEGVSYLTVEDAGEVILVNCDGIVLENLNLTRTDIGIELWMTNNTRITNNNIAANVEYGVLLVHSYYNIVFGNNITNNGYDINAGGIHLWKSSNNVIYHNNFINNTRHTLSSFASTNVWDDGYPSGGNYWSDYAGVDEKGGPNQDQPGSDGIGDTPYVIDENNRDRYPLMNPWSLVQEWSFDTDFQYNLDDNYVTAEGNGHIHGTATLSNSDLLISGEVSLGGQVPSQIPTVYLIATDGLDKEHVRQIVDLSQFTYSQTAPNTYTFQGKILNAIKPINNGHYEVEALITYNSQQYEFFINTSSRINNYLPLTTLPPPTADFSITPSSTFLTIQQGDLDTLTITVMSLNGFNQPVLLSVSGAPSGVRAAITPEIVTPPPDGSTTSKLTISVDTTAKTGSYSLTVTGTSGTTAHTIDITLEVSQLGEWSFAIITDIHIGWGYCDYGDSGYDDANLEAAQDYWLTSRLEKVVERIIQLKDAQNIKFVVVLGDIADTAEKSEFLKAREILNKLNDPNGDGDTSDGIPYIPIIGNHDIWPYTMQQGTDPDKRDEGYIAAAVSKVGYNPDSLGDRFFQKVFWEDQESKNNRDLITRLFGSSWKRQLHSSAPYLQNYKFSFGDMNFVCLDFNPRDPSMAYPGSKLGALVQLFGDTTTWLNDFLNENKGRNVVVFCHHPLSLEGGFVCPNEYVDYFERLRKDNKITIYDFGGHTHVNWISSSAMAQHVVETEAVYQESTEIIRLVKVNGQAIVNYNTFEGVAGSDPGLSLFFTLSPGNPSNNQDIHFMAYTIDFATGRRSERKVVELTIVPPNTGLSSYYYYVWNFGDGETLEGYGDLSLKTGADDPLHSYDYAGVYRLSLIVYTPQGSGVHLYDYRIFVSGELNPMHYICRLPENFRAVSTGRGVSVTEGGDGQNTFETVLITKIASPETPIVEFGVHFENATENIDLSAFMADVNIVERKAFFYMPSWPEVIEKSKTLYIPSTGAGAIYLCFNAKSLEEVSLENADMIIHVGETINGITVTTTYYNGTEYYVVSGVTGTGGGELPKYALTIITTIGGTTDPTPETYIYLANSSVQVTAIPDTNYIFDHWELDTINVGSANPYTVLMDKNHTLKAVFIYSPPPPPLSISISPLSVSILVGQSVTFTSTVSGGYPPYTYQWYLNNAPVSGAASATWIFTPTTAGIYYVHLKIIDAKGKTVQSEAARITVATVPVGGYSIPIQLSTETRPVAPYIALLTILTATFITIKRKTKRKHTP